MKYGITGARTVDQPGFMRMRDALGRFVIRSGDEVTSGAQYGVDTLAIRYLWHSCREGSPLFRLTLPTAPSNGAPVHYDMGLVAMAKANDWVVDHGPQGKNAAESYLLRDDMTVAYSERLLAFPHHNQEIQRSGTWATIRRARKMGLHVFVWPLDGSTPWTEEPQATRLFT